MKNSWIHGLAPLAFVLALGLVQEIGGHFIGTGSEQHGHLRTYNLNNGSPHSKSSNDFPFSEVIFGLLLWWLVPVCLWNNERIAIKQYKMQLKAERYAVHIDDPERDPLEEMDGTIAYLSGTSTVSQDLTDDKFPNTKSEGKIKLRRVVEMYQWVETEHTEDKDGQSRTYYTYDKQWRDAYSEVSHEDSKKNPPMCMESSSRGDSYRLSTAVGNGNGPECAEADHANVKVGAYYLGDYVIRELLNWQPKELSADMLKPKKLPPVDHGNPRFMKDEAKLDADGWWYFGSKNDIGDARVRFEELCPGPITIVGVLTKTSVGWTFVPIMRADAKGTGDSFCAELGGSCCFRVKELHYAPADEDGDDELKEALEKLGPELTKKEKREFNRSTTTSEIKSYNPEEDIEDLCCIGPFGGCVIQLMHWIGLEEEFLGVSEKEEELGTVMAREGKDAASRHHMMRLAGWLLLIVGSFMIISPVIRLLNFHWIATLLGGGLISVVLVCMACACSSGAFCCIVSVSWMAHRPVLASVGVALCILTFVGLYTFISEEDHKARRAPALLQLTHLHHYASHVVQKYSTPFFVAMSNAFGNVAI